jgi:fructose-bisphosphate aldolase class II
MLVHIKEIVLAAQTGQYGLGAFNTVNLEMTQGIVRAAAQANSPVIIQVSEKTIKYAGLETIVGIIKTVVEKEAPNVAIDLQLDHGHSLGQIQQCIAAGFSSVQIDASELPFAENVQITKEVVDYAHRQGVWVQGELGKIFGKEGLISLTDGLTAEKYLTDPQEAVKFVQQTNADTLAVAVGTCHGSFPGQEKINFTVLGEIHKLIDRPLVLHGASGVDDEELSQAVQGGATIVNIDTALRLAFTTSLQAMLKGENNLVDPREILAPSVAAVSAVVLQKIKYLGSNNK